MASRPTNSAPGRIADLALGAIILLAPLAAGGWNLEVLPFLALLAAVAWAASVYATRRDRRELPITGLGIGLLVLSAFTAFQAIPLPAGLLAALSGEAGALRAAVLGDAGGPISYEPGATLREAAKFLLYAMIAIAACKRARSRGSAAFVAAPVVWAGIASVAIAVMHRALGLTSFFGVLATRGDARGIVTTFVNPNHASGFLVLVALAALGLGLSETRPPIRLGWLIAAGMAVGTSFFAPSKGGILALVIGVGAFAVFWFLRTRADRRTSGAFAAAAVVVSVSIPLLAMRLEDVLGELGLGGRARVLGLDEKLAGVQDVMGLVGDHTWFGIGRGAFVSAYTRYKTSSLQLTFTFPENLAAQVGSEWGVLVGALALLALAWAIMVRLRAAREPLAIACAAGVLAIVAQNLADFSLEMPGIAIPVAAMLGAALPTAGRKLRLRGAGLVLAAAVPVVLLVGLIAGSYAAGDLEADLREVEVRVAAARAEPSAFDEGWAASLARRHPSNALLTARFAYLAEIAEPPALPEAARWANRTLYLAPTYAAGHLAAGRLLVRAGHRQQGFVALRTAWRLAGGDVRGTYIGQVVSLAKTPAEVLLAVPRRDEALDRPDERELAAAAQALASAGRPEWGRTILEVAVVPSEIPADRLVAVARAAQATGVDALAIQAAELRLANAPDDTAARLMAARLARKTGDLERAAALCAAVPQSADPLPFLRLRLLMAMDRQEWSAGREILDLIRARLPAGAASISDLAALESELERRSGNPFRSLEILNDALALRPADESLRMARAAVLRGLGRKREARSDVEAVLRRNPTHRSARKMAEDLGSGTD